MDREAHAENNFLIRAFARYCSVPQVVELFREQFGKPPTSKQIALTNLGKFIHDKSPYYQTNHRIKKFIAAREGWKASMKDLPIADIDWRMSQYQEIYGIAKARAHNTGNYTRALDILTMAAKDANGFYSPKTTNISVDSRSVTVNLTDDEINKRLSKLLGQFGVQVPDLPVIEKGNMIINEEPIPVEDNAEA